MEGRVDDPHEFSQAVKLLVVVLWFCIPGNNLGDLVAIMGKDLPKCEGSISNLLDK